MLIYVLMIAAATPEKPVKIRVMEPPKIQCSKIDCSFENAERKAPVLNGSTSEYPRTDDPIIAPPERVYTRPPIQATRPIPRTDPGGWLGPYDYPTQSLINEEEGVTGFRLTIGVDGKVSDCVITATSGYVVLDTATCRNITRRARFTPALDNDGVPTDGSYASRVAWKIPASPSFAKQIDFLPSGPQATFGARIDIDETDYPLEALENGIKGHANIVLSISKDGTVTGCTVKTGTGSPILDARTCEIATGWTFLPARDVNSIAIPGETSHDFAWILPDAWKEYQKTGLYPKKLVE